MLFIFIFLAAMPVFADLKIPGNLSTADRNAAVEILGYGSALKILGDPYPLGGFSGFEYGLSSEVLSTSEISRLGSTTVSQKQLNYYTITLGKGLYHNLDTFLNFAYYSQEENISSFGGQLRWGFYQAEYLPIYASLVLSGSSCNFKNVIVTNSQALDMVFGFREGDVTLYFGSGIIRAQGIFSGGTGGITDTGETENNSIGDVRFLAGVNIKFSKVFLALELDRYSSPVYSAKLGYRF
jgi:hypothetical protein